MTSQENRTKGEHTGEEGFEKGYIIYPTYRVEEEEAIIYLFGRLANHESFLIKKRYQPYFYIKKSAKITEEIQKQLRAFNATLEPCSYKNFADEEVQKLILTIPGDVPKLKKFLDEHNITCYEADIRFYQRFLIDHEILGSLEVKGAYIKGNDTIKVDRIYEEPEVRGTEWSPELKVLAIDIETDVKARTIFCISLYTEGIGGKEAYKQVLIRTPESLKEEKESKVTKKFNHAKSFPSEKAMLETFAHLMTELDPDIIVGWNVIEFDFKVIKERFEYHKIPFTLGRIDWPCKLELVKDFMRDSSADIPGRQVLDGIPLLKTSFVKLENYKLETAAEQFLGEKKTIAFKDKGLEIEDYFKHDQQKLVDYNLKDSELTYKIVFKTNAIQLTIWRSLITGMTLDRVRASVASLDSLFLRYAKKEGIVLNSSQYGEKEEAGSGGFVMESKPGLYDYVIVCDFKSLYPSLIKTFNIDPYSFIPKDKHPKLLPKEKYVTTANGAVFKNQEGILPKIISDVWKQRDAAKKRKDAQATHAFKITMNSFYGVISNPSCRFFNLDIANAITKTGQETIKLTATKVRELGYEVIYGDTDSLFIVTGANNIADAKNIGKTIQDHINGFYEDYIEKKYARKNYLEIQFEKLFKIFLMPKVRGSEEGAKKRYAGLLIKEEQGKQTEEVHFTGMEFVRGDWTDAAKKFQMELFDLIFHKQPYESYIRVFVADLLKGKYDKLLSYKKHITKSLDEYTKTTPPHVKAARKLGKITSTLIEYVMTTDGPEPVEKLQHKLDYEHYIEKQIKPIADTILVAAYNKTFDDVLKQSSQSSLSGF